MELSREELGQLQKNAAAFMHEKRFTPPCIMSGHPVDHVLRGIFCKVKNFSTITKVVSVNGGTKRAFLIYRYPLSWVHSVTDNLQRWACGRPSTKPFRRATWQKSFVPKSTIPVIDLGPGFEGLVAMEYVPNFNLWDMLQGNAKKLTYDQLRPILFKVIDAVNAMHAQGQSWGELIANNIILHEDSLEPVICDTEVEYWKRTPLKTRKMFDFRDLVFSICGASKLPPVLKESLAGELFARIQDRDTKALLATYCSKRRSVGQVIFWQGLGGCLSCSWDDYNAIKRAIVAAWDRS
ncbi:MAG: hypothetical protein A2677_03065 [Candidatus Komeilibacteria bacterium RIFCSPHIGHO2_01_FULL_52_14]|uniref:Protein kinase domain-containing protein n=1 Tax=Candidatus Komeilibacteria bacterium RIFCSPHIGHO2_01_FULL_52_14 TaxID=1798549 RepID=A0A1G2BR48_9BACT|nr:MAG: hypothetical protein A2677_03065 [Candidatus Komeilibacteria bacterium RIFCSPHIGHO2_01_FULL_52_14]